LSLIAPTSEVQHAITDDKIPPKVLRALRDTGVKVIVA
jgi:DeoR/GlpR family transcriptional regulator of sugar metabolism